MLDDDQKKIFEEKVTSKIEWDAKFVYTEEDVSRLIEAMMTIQDSKAYMTLIKEIKSVNEAYTQTILVEKQKKLKNKLNKRQVPL